eukprot:Hpha_TRINITY_DN26081_c0_g1::TRINITY_DN26081_c0_g1_i1::g.115197::m.115197
MRGMICGLLFAAAALAVGSHDHEANLKRILEEAIDLRDSSAQELARVRARHATLLEKVKGRQQNTPEECASEAVAQVRPHNATIATEVSGFEEGSAGRIPRILRIRLLDATSAAALEAALSSKKLKTSNLARDFRLKEAGIVGAIPRQLTELNTLLDAQPYLSPATYRKTVLMKLKDGGGAAISPRSDAKIGHYHTILVPLSGNGLKVVIGGWGQKLDWKATKEICGDQEQGLHVAVGEGLAVWHHLPGLEVDKSAAWGICPTDAATTLLRFDYTFGNTMYNYFISPMIEKKQKPPKSFPVLPPPSEKKKKSKGAAEEDPATDATAPETAASTEDKGDKGTGKSEPPKRRRRKKKQ